MIITNFEELKNFCQEIESSPYITIDTEFVREKTYWPVPCLIQISAQKTKAVAIDLIDYDFPLTPLFDILKNKQIVKVFHSARQDIEILYKLMGDIPNPIFDTQIAAMVCGYGDSVSYEFLVKDIAKQHLNKQEQYSDWSKRPLSKSQINYALNDVIFLKKIYSILNEKIKKTNREKWLDEEINKLTNINTYIFDPTLAWKKIKTNIKNSSILAVLQKIAEWREIKSSELNIPRKYLLTDDTLIQLCLKKPETEEALRKVRGFKKIILNNKNYQKEILKSLEIGIADSKAGLTPLPPQKVKIFPKELNPVYYLLKSYLSFVSNSHKIAEKMLISSSDLKKFVQDPSSCPNLLTGWRYELFGKTALDIINGKKTLKISNKKLIL